MTQEEFQRLVLEKLMSLETGQTQLKKEMGELKEEVHDIKSEMGEFKEEIRDIRSEMGELKEAVCGIKSELGDLKKDVCEIREFQKTSVLEIIEFVYEHTCTKDDLSASMKALNDDMFIQKVELNKLKLVK